MDGVSLRRTDGHVAQILLDRPEALNALSTAMAARLAAVCAEVAGDDAVRAVVLDAVGENAFSVGADLKERNAMTDAELHRQREVFRAAACRNRWSPPCTATPWAAAASSRCAAT